MLLKFRKYKNLFLFVSDILIVFMAYIMSSLLLNDFTLPRGHEAPFILHISIVALTYVVIFYLFSLYGSLWTVAGYYDYMSVVIANTIAGILVVGYNVFLLNKEMSIAMIIIAGGIILMGTLSMRMLFRIYRRLLHEKYTIKKVKTDGSRNILIVGAGQAAAMIIKEIRNHEELGMNIVGLIDDNVFKQKSRISGIKVLGTTEDIPEMVEKFEADEILLAIPSSSHEERRRILNIAKTTNAKLKTLPGVYEMVDQGIDLKSIRDVEISDLLGRKEIHLNNEKISEYIENKVVLVTGGGGSIGSELCRQIASLKPKKLVIVDIYENNAYDIQNELLRKYPSLNILVLIASVRDKKKIERIFEENQIQTVFHAAAHKHVPLMETSPEEAIKNNVFGTLNVATAARDFKAEKFILISTDKAVNPTNIMGASKRLCEMIVQTVDTETKDTDYVAVRFGNVLGSNGSVIPLFKEQIKNGGPVTLTHKDIVRYFMTIPEAVQLVLQAGSYANGGEIFVLDMGEPVKIYDLATNLIKLSGFEPGKDIKIKITGLRPGEKLYEELLMAEEGLESTPNELIYVGRPNSFNQADLRRELQILKEKLSAENLDQDQVKEIILRLVPTYVPDFNEVNIKIS